jgi:cytochrome c oxidase subunit 3
MTDQNHLLLSKAAQAADSLGGGGEKHRIDYTGAKMGMWIFLFTEIIFFGGLFLVYSVYRDKYTLEFHNSAGELDLLMGTANTVVLLTSSMTMALSIALLKEGRKKASLLCQGMSLFLGTVFLIVKYVEWSAHIAHGLYPDSPSLISTSMGKIVFFSLYYVMTGLHGLHVFIGIAVVSGLLILTAREQINQQDFVKLENGGLYWHFVDVVWIYLFPLFYLIT